MKQRYTLKFHHTTLLAFFIVFIISSLGTTAFGQEKEKPTLYGKMRFVREVPSLASQLKNGTFKAADRSHNPEEINPKRRRANQVVPGKGFPKDGDPLIKKRDHKNKSDSKSYILEPINVFEANVSNFTPSDPTGAAGPNHYVAAWNVGFAIFDKNGNALTEAASLGTLFEGNEAGDPIVLYDAPADRFIITQFENEDESDADNDFDNGLNIAICQGSDPVNDGWYVYTAGFETGAFPDYPKYSVWHDGYYITSNIAISGGDATGDAVFVMEREKMLQGLSDAGFLGFPLPTLQRTGFYSPQFFNISTANAPTTGGATVLYFQDDGWSGVDDDHLKLWTVDVDWDTPENSSISQPEILTVSDFDGVFDGGSFSNLPQPAGAEIDAMQGTVMNQAQFRKFDDHNSAIFNFVVNVAPLGEEQAGIRWYELRQTGDGQPWTIYQEGTYVSPTGNNAFGASMAMDGAGSIAMGYTTVSADLPVTLNFTGRYTNDPLGEMSVPEAFLASSTGVSTSERYADYTHLTIDPADDETFWFISEYFNPQRTDIVSVFKLAPDNANDVQVIAIDSPQDGALSATESISITIRNAGSTTQTSIPVSYTVDGVTVEETYTGSLAFNETASYTFTQTADLSTIGADYTIEASTNLENDEDTSNDTMSITVKNLWQNDVGVASIDTPESNSGLGAAIAISVTVTNYGQDAQSNFPVYYQLNDGEQVTETFDRSIAAQTSETFTFSTTEDFSAIGTYEITAGTALETDSDTSNDIASVTVTNDYCQPVSNCSGFGDGVTLFTLEGTLVTPPCSSTGYSANLETTFNLNVQKDSHMGTLQMGYQNSGYVIFIDFNNNGGFETSELVSSGTVETADTDAVFTIDLPEGVELGTYRMRIRGKDNNEEGDLNDPCGELAYGRTNDYSVRIFNSLSVEENIFPESELVILEPEQNHFQISLSTEETTEKMAVSVYSILGQKLAENWIENEYGSYVYDLDMSYAASGVYIVRIGNRTGGQSKKIIVK